VVPGTTAIKPQNHDQKHQNCRLQRDTGREKEGEAKDDGVVSRPGS